MPHLRGRGLRTDVTSSPPLLPHPLRSSSPSRPASRSRRQSSIEGSTLAGSRAPTAVMAAPLAHFDEDWQDFNEFRPSSASAGQLDKLNSNVGDSSSGLDDFSDLDNSFSGEICSFKSMEDLVHDFDEKLTVCFRNYNTTTENIAPIKSITEDNYLKDDE